VVEILLLSTSIDSTPETVWTIRVPAVSWVIAFMRLLATPWSDESVAKILGGGIVQRRGS
jgi:hypothetical protein